MSQCRYTRFVSPSNHFNYSEVKHCSILAALVFRFQKSHRTAQDLIEFSADSVLSSGYRR